MALHLPINGPLPEDWKILQFTSSDDLKTQERLKNQFYKLCQTWHPDHFQGNREKEIATNIFSIINQAYIRLKNNNNNNKFIN